MDRKAQLAITDAIIFLLLMSLSAAISLMGSSSQLAVAEIDSGSEVKEYAEDTFIVLMRSTLDLEGCGMNDSRLTIDKYILLRTAVEDDGANAESLVPCDVLLFDFARGLVLERYDFHLTSYYRNESSGRVAEVVFARPDAGVPSEYFKISWNYPMTGFGKSGDSVASLVLWRK
ncbi:MAG: hypothetical protein ACE5IJ_03805 [Thermoplasmata archaeon]